MEEITHCSVCTRSFPQTYYYETQIRLTLEKANLCESCQRLFGTSHTVKHEIPKPTPKVELIINE